jgi:hypothetical protein
VARGLDLWELRNAYGDVASGFAAPQPWLTEHVSRGRGWPAGEHEPRLSEIQERRTLALLGAAAMRLQMFASDGWFWGDPRRLETAQAMRCAAFAARTVDAELGTDLETELVADLAALHAPEIPDQAIPQLIDLHTGDEIYRAALAGVGQPPPES